MSYFSQVIEGQADTCSVILGNVPVSEFLSCVKRSCDTITVNQLDILNLFKRNLLAIKSEIDTCINQLIGREMHLKSAVSVSNDSISGNFEQPNNSQIDRSKNIVIHGLNSLRQVKNCELIDNVTDFLSCVLNVSTAVKNFRLINKATRCVAIVELVSRRGKSEIFRNCHKLKNYHEKISITDDLSPTERHKFKQKSPKNVKKSQGVVEDNVDVLNPMSNTEPATCYPVQVSEKQKLEDMPHAYFWMSAEVESKLQEMCSFGSKYEFTGLDFHEISRLVAIQNLERLDKLPCICDSYMDIQWERVKDEFGRKIPKKVVKKFKQSMIAMQAIWNEKHSKKFTECYCKHILSGVNVQK